MALALRMTRKCVVSEGVMVTVFSDSDLSLRLTCEGVSGQHTLTEPHFIAQIQCSETKKTHMGGI